MLNIVLASDNNYIHYLGVCIISILKNNSRDFENIYDDVILEDAIKNPTYLHFSGYAILRPWINKNLKCRQIYEEYAKLTPFNNYVFLNEGNLTQREIFIFKIYKSKFFKILIKITPQNVLELSKKCILHILWG